MDTRSLVTGTMRRGSVGIGIVGLASALALGTIPVSGTAEAADTARYQLAVNWPRDIAQGIEVRPNLTQHGKTVTTPVDWTLKTYQVVNGEILARRIIDQKQTRGGTTTLKTRPPVGGEVSGFFVVVADTATNRWGSVTVSAKAMYRCGAPDSCTLRKTFPVRVDFHRGP